MTDTLARTIAILVVLLVLAIGPVLIGIGDQAHIGWLVGAGWIVLGIELLAALVWGMWLAKDARRRGLR